MKIYTVLILAALLVGCQPEKEKIIIPEGKVGLIGYGSLTSSKQMEQQLGKKYDGPVQIVHLTGYQRNWNMVFPNNLPHPPVDHIIMCIQDQDTIIPQSIVNPNLEVKEGAFMNACFFIIDEQDLSIIDRTEKGYERIEVTQSIREFEVSQGKVYAYQALPNYTSIPVSNNPYKNVIPDVYLEFLNAAFKEKGEAYKKEFEQTTVGFDESLILECSIENNSL